MYAISRFSGIAEIPVKELESQNSTDSIQNVFSESIQEKVAAEEAMNSAMLQSVKFTAKEVGKAILVLGFIFGLSGAITYFDFKDKHPNALRDIAIMHSIIGCSALLLHSIANFNLYKKAIYNPIGMKKEINRVTSEESALKLGLDKYTEFNMAKRLPSDDVIKNNLEKTIANRDFETFKEIISTNEKALPAEVHGLIGGFLHAISS